ncbi:MAG: ankyrin repeat domain-containing protein [Spirochaetia bacterium]|nr:ankyrin repeat domain-containing protein [Spirochaetia bacterium]
MRAVIRTLSILFFLVTMPGICACAAVASGVVSESVNESDGEVLRYNAQTDNLPYVKRLIEERKVPVDSADGYERTALFLASEKGLVPIVQYLASKGADVNKQDSTGETALLAAVRQNQVEVVRGLLSLGADTKLRDKNNETALDSARRRGRTVIVEILTGAK